MTNCPYCQEVAELEKSYNMLVCKNRACSFYLKDDVRNTGVKLVTQARGTYTTTQGGRKLHSMAELVDDIMTEFDFAKTQEIMRYLNWQWSSLNGVPTVTDLRAFVRHNLEKIILEGRNRKADAAHITGGFELRYFYEVDYLEVKFVLTEWETCLPELN